MRQLYTFHADRKDRPCETYYPGKGVVETCSIRCPYSCVCTGNSRQQHIKWCECKQTNNLLAAFYIQQFYMSEPCCSFCSQAVNVCACISFAPLASAYNIKLQNIVNKTKTKTWKTLEQTCVTLQRLVSSWDDILYVNLSNSSTFSMFSWVDIVFYREINSISSFETTP